MSTHLRPADAEALAGKQGSDEQADVAPDPAQAPVQANLYQLLAPFTGYRYRFLLALLKDPSRLPADICREIGVQDQQAWTWRSVVPGFKAAMEAIREGRADLRTEYAKLAFLEATPKVADAMVTRAQGQGNAAQRAAERILETVGVLPKPNAEVSQTPIQVHTHTYFLVQPGQEPKPFIVETSRVVETRVKELPAPSSDST